jgi:tetratricopeptide (TPR) repeat protein
MTRTAGWIAAGALLLLGAGAKAVVQVGAVQGRVVGENGDPVADTRVQLVLLSGTPLELETRTDDRGQYTQVGLRAGSYRITVTRDGYRGTSFEARVGAGEPTRLPDVLIVSLDAARAEAADSQENREIAALFDAALERADTGDDAGALAALEEALALRPAFPEALYNIGFIQMRRERWDEAEAALKKALEQRPDYPAASVALSALYRKTGRRAEAAALVQSAAESGTADAGVFFKIGIERMNAQDDAGAAEAFLKAEELDPGFAEVQFHLATLALGQGRTDETMERLERYLSLSPPEAPNRATAEGLLAALRKRASR